MKASQTPVKPSVEAKPKAPPIKAAVEAKPAKVAVTPNAPEPVKKIETIKNAVPEPVVVPKVVKPTEEPAKAPPPPVETKIEPASVRELVKTSAAITAPLQEGIDKMATAATSAAPERVQALFGDFNERAKTAFEKSTKIGEEMAELTKGNLEALAASARIAVKGAEGLAQEAAEYSKKNFESASSAFKGFASVKSPTELFQLHSEFMKAAFDGAITEASKISESLTKLAGEVSQPLSSRYSVAMEKLKATSL
jgi:phasin family protein